MENIVTSLNIYKVEALNCRKETVVGKAVIILSVKVQRKDQSQRRAMSRVRVQAKGREIPKIGLQTRQVGDKNLSNRNKSTKQLGVPF